MRMWWRLVETWEWIPDSFGPGIEEERLRRWLEEPPTWASDDERGIFSERSELKIGRGVFLKVWGERGCTIEYPRS
jgi:hypothetical protein